MPKIVGIETKQNLVPGAVETREVTPDQRGAGVGRGLETLGGALQTLTTTLHAVYQDSRASKYAANAQQRLQDFAFTLKNGTVDPETGEHKAPPTPDQHYALYQKEVEKINQDAERNLDGRALSGFNSEFKPFAARHGYAVRAQAVDMYNADIQANTDEALRQDAINFVNADNLNKPAVAASAMRRIDRLQELNIYTPQEALARRKNFQNDTAVGNITKMMQQNPDDVVRAIDNGEFNNDLDVDKLQHYRARALEEGDRRLRRKIMDEEHAEARARREEHETQQTTFKDLYTQLIEKKLTPSAVMDQEDNLSPEHYKILLDATSGRGVTHSDPQVLSNLLVRASTGENVIGEATTAATNGLLGVDDLKSIITHVDHEGVALEASNVYKTGKNFIHETMKDIPGVPNIAGQLNRANALREWTDWVQAHPKATPEQGRQVTDSIVKGYSLINFNEMSIATPLPRYMNGSRLDLNPDAPGAFEKLQRAYKATEEALQKGQIDAQEFKAETEKLVRWGALIPRPQATPTATTK